MIKYDHEDDNIDSKSYSIINEIKTDESIKQNAKKLLSVVELDYNLVNNKKCYYIAVTRPNALYWSMHLAKSLCQYKSFYDFETINVKLDDAELKPE